MVPPSKRDDGFRIVHEAVSYKRYMTVYDRTVQFPESADNARHAYDVVGHPRAGFHFASIFPFHPGPEPAVTMIREYAQGPNHYVWSFPAGGVDLQRHASLEDTAAAELSEECHLKGGELVRLLPADHPGILETKWCRCVPRTVALFGSGSPALPALRLAATASRRFWLLTRWWTRARASATPRSAA